MCGDVEVCSLAQSSKGNLKAIFRAFVAMQYFGYLLRDPEDAGYNDWVDVLANGRPPVPPGDFRHLIFGFVWSVEYRQRFGP